MKKVLVVYYSQTGQLTRIVQSMMAPLVADPSIEVAMEALRPEQDYPFPWPLLKFFDTFPETVASMPAALAEPGFDGQARFDVIVLAYTVWFLSPSLPVTGFLQSARGREALRDTPVITVIGCRNMWLMAQEKVKGLLAAAGGRLIDNVVFVDRGSSLATFITTPYWMLTGKREALFGLLPRAGVSEEDIRGAARFGRAIAEALSHGVPDGSAPLLRGLEAARADIRLLTSEKVGARSFKVWGSLLRALGSPGSVPRLAVLCMYIAFLVTLILTVVPVSMAVRALLRPLFRKRHEALKTYYEQPSGSDNFRMKEFQDA